MPFTEMYVTGLPTASLYANITSMFAANGFSGCIGTFEINGDRPDLAKLATRGVKTGCPGMIRYHLP